MKRAKIFLSYSWKNQQEVDVIDNDFRSFGINIIRDIRSLTYKDSIKTFMDSIANSDFALVFISPEFLCSESCMYEIAEIFKTKDHAAKILPVMLPSHDFLKPQNRLEYIKFWDKKIVELNGKLKNVDFLVNIDSIIAELNHFHNIRSSIDKIMKLFYDMNCLTFEQLKNKNYKPIFDYIGFSQEKITEEIIRINKISDIEEQETQIRKLLFEYPNNEDILYSQINIALKSGNYELAGERCDFFLKLFPNSAPGHSNFSIVLKRVYTEFQKAKKHAEKAIELDPLQPVYWQNLANLFLENLNDPKEAERCYKEAIRLNPAYFNAYEGLGYLYEFELKDFNKAENYYLKAFEINPSKELIYHRLSNFHARLNNIERAEEFYDKLLEVNPRTEKGHYNYGKFLQDKKKDYPKAKEHYERAFEINPYYAKAHHNYALLMLYNYRDFDKAEKHLKIAGMYDEEFKNSSFKDQIELLKSIASKGQQLSDNDYNAPVLSVEFPKALLKLTKSIIKEPTDWFEVKDDLLNILEIHPKYDWARQLLMNIYKGILGEYDEGFKHFLLLLENNSDNPSMHEEVASIYQDYYKNYNKAIEHLKKSIALKPEDANVYLKISMLYLTKLFEPKLAREYYSNACELNEKCIIEELDEAFDIKRKKND